MATKKRAAATKKAAKGAKPAPKKKAPPKPLVLAADNNPGAIATYKKSDLQLIKDTVAKGASDPEFKLFMYICKNTGLNPLLRQIYSIRRRRWDAEKWNQEEKKWGDYEHYQVTQIGIEGFRLIAQRTGEYAGQVGPYWRGKDKDGNQITMLDPATGKQTEWLDHWTYNENPEAARVGILRKGFEQPVWGYANWDEYAQYNNKNQLQGLWLDMPANQLAKCAEALGLRKAFPAELSGLYSHDELRVEDPQAPALDGKALNRIADKAQRVHVLAGKLKYKEEKVRARLKERFGKNHAKQLTEEELDLIIMEMTEKINKAAKVPAHASASAGQVKGEVEASPGEGGPNGKAKK